MSHLSMPFPLSRNGLTLTKHPKMSAIFCPLASLRRLLGHHLECRLSLNGLSLS